MQREQFLITSTQGHHVIKYKWSSANREVEKMIGEIAIQEGETYRLIDSKSEKVGFYFVSGVRIWATDYDPKEISFFITKIA